jgi:PmbA protein
VIARLTDTAQSVIRRAQEKGAMAADVFIQQQEAFSVTVRMGDVETLKEAVSRSLGCASSPASARRPPRHPI